MQQRLKDIRERETKTSETKYALKQMLRGAVCAASLAVTTYGFVELTKNSYWEVPIGIFGTGVTALWISTKSAARTKKTFTAVLDRYYMHFRDGSTKEQLEATMSDLDYLNSTGNRPETINEHVIRALLLEGQRTIKQG